MDKTEYVLLNYVRFLNSTLEDFQKLNAVVKNSSYLEEIKNDYLQANWELLVESIICEPGEEFLPTYGEGADCNENSSRVSFPKKMPTHRIKIISKRFGKVLDRIIGEEIEIQEYLFDSFVSYSNKGYDVKFPMNGILVEHKIKNIYAVIDINDVVFEKIKVGDGNLAMCQTPKNRK